MNLQNRQRAKAKESRFRGVFYEGRPNRKPWVAAVTLNCKKHHLGSFDDEVKAARTAQAFRDEYMPFALPDPELLALDRRKAA